MLFPYHIICCFSCQALRGASVKVMTAEEALQSTLLMRVDRAKSRSGVCGR